MNSYLRQRYELEKLDAAKRREFQAAKLRGEAAKPVQPSKASSVATPQTVTEADIQKLRQAVKRAGSGAKA